MSLMQNETLNYLKEHFPQIVNYVPDDVLGMVTHKMSLITFFGRNHLRQKFHQKFDIFS